MTVQPEQVTTVNAEWSITLVGDHADIHALPTATGESDGAWQPRAGHGDGIGIPLVRLGSLIDAVQATLADPTARELIARHGEQPAWSRPGIDRTERVVYLHGPVSVPDAGSGYGLTSRFQVPVQTLRQLCTRLRGAAAQSTTVWPR
ncbi:hypothetical protein [Kutzneria buriramensis]|uniref:Uncharacterized protein n=1 Tax=Kutzneria buriramensis TaxID=1045776 RepID=A0A3E0HD97_9PSEU|nr:hypothetical protein [Kutzneria buriramensis]REH42719.1 hypothetical protein BCF44_110216 [Kutzneria buriramensis]